MHRAVVTAEFPLSALTLLVGLQKGHPAGKNMGVGLLVVTI